GCAAYRHCLSASQRKIPSFFLASAFDADPVISSKGLHGSSLASGGTTLLAASSFLIRESLRRSDFLRDQDAVKVVLLTENAGWCDGFGDYFTAQEMNRHVFRREFATKGNPFF